MTPSPQLPLDLDRLPPPSFDNFWAGPNAGVVAALRSAAGGSDWISVSGAPGSGKTHLLSAVAGSRGRRAQFLSGRSLRGGAESAVLDAYGGCDLLCCDDLHRLLGERDWEEALFHLLNRLRANRAGLIFSVPTSPSRLNVGLPDLASRLAWGTHLKLAPLSDADKGEVLRTRAADCGLRLEPGVVEMMLRRLPRDLHTLVRALDRLAEASLAQKRRVTTRFVSEAIASKLIQSDD